MADTQNKAIFVFTAVTIVFLPLSFTLLSLTVMLAFRHRIYRRVLALPSGGERFVHEMMPPPMAGT